MTLVRNKEELGMGSNLQLRMVGRDKMIFYLFKSIRNTIYYDSIIVLKIDILKCTNNIKVS